VGSVEDEVPDVTSADVEESVLATLAARFEVREARLDEKTLALARRL
jgi:hypothetical protein